MTTPVWFRRALVKADLQRMNLPEEHWMAKVQFVSESVRPAVERYLTCIHERAGTGAGLLIHGAAGVGKTSIASLIAKEARSRGFTVLFVHIWELREMIRSKIPFSDEATMVDRAREVDVLVLDDLREEDAKEKFLPLSDLQALIRYRSSRRKLTILTTRIALRVLEAPPLSGFSEVLLHFPVMGPNLHREKKKALEEAVFGR